ncbi:MAG TPA: sugar transferase [Pedobacter sp.]|nr:sugar transferase [Pedobacter sp.]
MLVKRLFDVSLSLTSVIMILPVFIIVAILLKLDSKGAVFYRQVRVGLNEKKFKLLKFRTMYENSDQKGLLTVGDRDMRITRVGYWLRRYKIDELPQLINVLNGDMSFVGPRPEVSKYVELYDSSQKRVLTVKPGITDWASIEFIDESKLLAAAQDPESFYINTIIPQKISQNLKYIDHHSIWIDLKIISYTLVGIVIK